MIPQVGGFQGCYLDNHRNNCAVRNAPFGPMFPDGQGEACNRMAHSRSQGLRKVSVVETVRKDSACPGTPYRDSPRFAEESPPLANLPAAAAAVAYCSPKMYQNRGGAAVPVPVPLRRGQPPAAPGVPAGAQQSVEVVSLGCIFANCVFMALYEPYNKPKAYQEYAEVTPCLLPCGAPRGGRGVPAVGRTVHPHP